jgi:hypothetical protein
MQDAMHSYHHDICYAVQENDEEERIGGGSLSWIRRRALFIVSSFRAVWGGGEKRSGRRVKQRFHHYFRVVS